MYWSLLDQIEMMNRFGYVEHTQQDQFYSSLIRIHLLVIQQDSGNAL